MVSSRVEGFTGFWVLSFPSTKKMEFLLNDGCNNWLKSGGGNFAAGPGLWTLRAGRLQQFQPGKAEVKPQVLSGDITELEAQGGVVLVYQSNWPQPRLHYRTSEEAPWTDPPGEDFLPCNITGFPQTGGWWAMKVEGQSLEFVPNDGGSQWHKAAGGNWRIKGPGIWKLSGDRLEKVGSVEPEAALVVEAEPAKAAKAAKAEVAGAPVELETIEKHRLADLMQGDHIVILYRSAWETPHLHCRDLSSDVPGPWTQLPGLSFTAAGDITQELEGSGSLFVAKFTTSVHGVEFVLNDGGPHYRWDKASGGGNFRASGFGVWLASGGRLDKLQAPPVAKMPTVASVSRTSVALSWTSASSSVKGYRVFRNGKQVASLAGGVLQYMDAGLFAAHEYSFAVAAVSTQGVLGPISEAATATTDPPGKPGKPSSLRVALSSGKGVTLEWAPPEDHGGAPVTAYVVQRGDKTVATLAAEKLDKLSWTDTEVTRGDSYSYSVIACHLPPTSEKDDLREKVLKACEADDILLSLPEEMNMSEASGPVETVAVDELEVGSCKVSLRDQLSEVVGITVFYQSCWGTECYAHCCSHQEKGWTPLPGVPLEPSPCHSFSESEDWMVLCLPYARSLEFVMNDGGRGWDKAPGGKNYKVMTPGVFLLTHGHLDPVAYPPQEPTGLAAEAIDGSRVRLSWEPPKLGDGEAPVKGYRIFRNGRIIGSQSLSCEYEDINLFAFTDYEYSVSAINRQDVAGPLSEAVNVKTQLPGLPSAPRNVRANTRNMQDGKLIVQLEWEPPADCGGAPVASYEIIRDGTVIDIFDVPNARIRSEAEAAKPMAPEAAAARRWIRSSCSYSSLSWFKDAMLWVDNSIELGECYSYQVRAVQLGPERAGQLKKGGVVQRCGSQFLDNVLPDVVGPASEPAQVRAVAFLDPPKIGDKRSLIVFQSFDWGSCKAPSWYNVLLGLLPELRSAGINMVWLPPPSDSVDEHGYLPRQWRVGQQLWLGRGATAPDSEHARAGEIIPMLDVVVNHRCASLQDSAGRWLKFEEPDWEGWAVCHDSPAVPGGSGAHTTGEPAAYAPSVDHSNPRIQADVNEYIRYLMDEIGFRALRFDFVKGYAPRFQSDYVRAAGSPFAVAENWNGDANGLHDYVRQCQGLMAVYDFPLYYTLKRCIHSNNFEEMNCGGRLAGIAGRDPARSCTFIDNHDTYQLAIVGGCFGNNDQALRGYALILTHPGVPTVFHWDYVRAPFVREKLLELCAIRRDANIHSTSQLNIAVASHGLYAAIIDNKVAVKIGTNEWSPGGGWKVRCFGAEFCVWARS
ncbi:unnamed protein product [Effrenium voratum]|uniref:Fibronectin type-III domain-containing protein n=1 Tax=Effrenium voratum TaxID=2562239 RepID=A0AA36HQD6_9DINO|nr:unnamed protein product [Effrenium voratum]